MSQYGTKVDGSTVSVTNGSAIVTGIGTTFLTSVSVGSLFTINGSNVPYVVASIYNNTSLNLAGNYGGSTASGLSYNITTSYTPVLGIPYMEQGDIDTQTIFKRAMLLLENYIGWKTIANIPTNALTTATLAYAYTYFTGTAGASFAVTFPSSPANGQFVVLLSTFARVNATAAGAIGFPTTMAANTPYKFQYNAGAWYPSL